MTIQPGSLRKTCIRHVRMPDDRPRIYMLGGFQIICGSKHIRSEHIHLRRARDLTKLLALAPDHRIHQEQMMEYLWPEQNPQKTRHSLNQILYCLRPILSSLSSTFTITLAEKCLVLTAQPGIWTDVEAFETAVHSLRVQPEPAGYWATLQLYRGDLLPDDQYSDLYSRRREQLRQAWMFLLMQMAAFFAHQQDYAQAVAFLQQLVEVDPANEEAQGMLVMAYENSGHRCLALKQYRVMAEILQQEYGAAPSPESQRLYAHLLDPNLELSPTTPNSPSQPVN